MDWHERIVADPAVLAGKPVVKGTRLAVEIILELLANGWREKDILRNYPALTYAAQDLAEQAGELLRLAAEQRRSARLVEEPDMGETVPRTGL